MGWQKVCLNAPVTNNLPQKSHKARSAAEIWFHICGSVTDDSALKRVVCRKNSKDCVKRGEIRN